MLRGDILTAREFVIKRLSQLHWTMDNLAANLGRSDKSSVSHAIAGNGMQMKLDTFRRMVEEMDCQLIVISADGDEFTIDDLEDGIDYKRNEQKGWC
jgi:hypothetical protein